MLQGMNLLKLRKAMLIVIVKGTYMLVWGWKTVQQFLG
jgi:hypothetical protein